MRRLIARLEAKNAELRDHMALIRPHCYQAGDWTAYDRLKSAWLHNEAQLERLYLRIEERRCDICGMGHDRQMHFARENYGF